MILAKKLTDSSTTPERTPTILAGIAGMRVGRSARSRAWGAGMMRGSRHGVDAVRVWEWSEMLLSPMTANSVTTSSRQPGDVLAVVGNHRATADMTAVD